MNKALIFLAAAAVVCSAASSHGQDFANLNFESAQIIPVSTNGNGSVNVATANALPGWTAFDGTTQLSLIAYDTPPSVVSPAVGLMGGPQAPAIEGNFDVAVIHGGSIAQIALVPTDAESLFFDVALDSSSQPFLVSMDGQDLSYSAVANEVDTSGLTFIVYGADVSPFADKTETLTFSAGAGSGGGGILDGIQFSPTPVPEPTVHGPIILHFNWNLSFVRHHKEIQIKPLPDTSRVCVTAGACRPEASSAKAGYHDRHSANSVHSV